MIIIGIDDELNDNENDLGSDDNDEFGSIRDTSRSRFTLPEISKKETALIDKWYEKYIKMKDPDELKAHLDAFIDKYPHLMDHLELNQEVILKYLHGFIEKTGIKTS